MPTRIGGVNVTVFPYLNVSDAVYVGGIELVAAGGTPNATDPFTQRTALNITGKLFNDGISVIPTGDTIPADFGGAVLKNVNVTKVLAIGGVIAFDNT